MILGWGCIGVCPPGRFLKFGPLCIQVADVELDAAVLPDATATSGVSDVGASPNHVNELSLIKYTLKLCCICFG